MSLEVALEGTCCWEIDKSGCLRGFVVQNSSYLLFVINLYPPPFEGVNFALSTHPNSFYLTPYPPLTAANVIWVFREFSVKDEVTNKNPFVILILYYKRDSSVLIEFWCSATLFLTAILCYVMFC